MHRSMSKMLFTETANSYFQFVASRFFSIFLSFHYLLISFIYSLIKFHFILSYAHSKLPYILTCCNCCYLFYVLCSTMLSFSIVFFSFCFECNVQTFAANAMQCVELVQANMDVWLVVLCRHSIFFQYFFFIHFLLSSSVLLFVSCFLLFRLGCCCFVSK